RIKVLCLDLGQAFVVGACALLPDTLGLDKKARMTFSDQDKNDKMKAVSTSNVPSSTMLSAAPSTVAVPLMWASSSFVLSVSPSTDPASWTIPSTSSSAPPKPIPQGFHTSISEIESMLSAWRGADASVFEYLEYLEDVEERLDNYYNGDRMRYKRHDWDATRARNEEFKTIANRPLGPLGSTIGAKRDTENLAVIGVGLGEFDSKNRCVVVGINEYFTSKKCPICLQFVCQVNIRRLIAYTVSNMYIAMFAAHYMCNIVKGYLMYHRGLLYLQPADKDGNYLWMESDGDSACSEPTRTRTTTSQDLKIRQAADPMVVDDGKPITGSERRKQGIDPMIVEDDKPIGGSKRSKQAMDPKRLSTL
ncbi:hypothetical protein BG015_004706, partial [Linnemannia schmuckeri]